MHSPGARNRSPASGVPGGRWHRRAVRCVHRRTRRAYKHVHRDAGSTSVGVSLPDALSIRGIGAGCG
jgi:hypothetical protein